MNAPDPTYSTLNLHFGAFSTVSVHSGPFGFLTKLGAKRAELVQKFVQRSRVEIFRNERTRSTPSDHKLTFSCISYYLGVFKNRCKTGRTSAKVRATKSRRNFSQRTHRSTTLEPKLTFWCVLYYLGAFGTVWLPYETRCKIDRTSSKVASKFFATNAPDPPH